MVTGQSNFSWANIAASAASSAMGGRLPGDTSTTGLNFGEQFVMGVAGSAVGYGVNRALGGDRSWSNESVLSDAFGNAIGNSIVGHLQERENTKKLQERISKEFSNIKVQGADDLSAYLPEHDRSNLIGDGYSYDGGSNSVTDISELAAKSGFFAEDLKLKQLSLDASTARINSFETDMYHMDGEVKSVFRGFEQKGIVNDDLLRAEIGNYFDDNLDVLPEGWKLTNDYYNTRNGLETAQNIFDTTAINGALLATATLHEGFKLGFGSTSPKMQSLSNGIMGSYFERIYNGNKAPVLFDYGLDTTKFVSGVSQFGDSLTKAGMLFTVMGSGFNLAEDHFTGDGIDFGDGFREGGYIATNLAFGASSISALKNVSSLARLSPVGMVFTGVDIAVQNLPAHTVKFGSQAGQQKTGWTGLWYSSVDYEAQKIVNGTTWTGPKY